MWVKPDPKRNPRPGSTAETPQEGYQKARMQNIHRMILISQNSKSWIANKLQTFLISRFHEICLFSYVDCIILEIENSGGTKRRSAAIFFEKRYDLGLSKTDMMRCADTGTKVFTSEQKRAAPDRQSGKELLNPVNDRMECILAESNGGENAWLQAQSKIKWTKSGRTSGRAVLPIL